ncbi:uncharacterized protein F4822DRAFT_444531 [Hypoxylon trugodes]|uniref:uncharacterized protein n=1 Tax=Hypoxylon trugodes TaxID=326681 RepID=UPI0021A1C829|nr:uncharacterized protein F4822DRAFT_444531 [Hypoxylon trugodes]KAI1388069.1 hypothetical protein F4822DRAFT_444531 [Hypoxylon trugodes]
MDDQKTWIHNHTYYVSSDEENSSIDVGPSASQYDSEDETRSSDDYTSDANSEMSMPSMRRNKATRRNKSASPARHEDIPQSSETPTNNSGKLTDEEFHERQIAYGLSTVRRNLTRLSQFILKLEARAGKVTKQGIQQTLDATVADNTDRFERDDYPTHLKEIEEIKHLTESTWQRLYLIDRHWKRQHRRLRDDEGKSPKIQLENEHAVKELLEEEMRLSRVKSQETCFFTVGDLIKGREFIEWLTYLKIIGRFKDHPTDQMKLVNFAWEFLDRDLRGPRPVNPTTMEEFADQLEEKYLRGGFYDAMTGDPEKADRDDENAWKAIEKFWFTRFQH